MINMPTNILPASALANVGAEHVKQHSCGLSQNGLPVEFGQPLFVIG
jgi:hypothetical protein